MATRVGALSVILSLAPKAFNRGLSSARNKVAAFAGGIRRTFTLGNAIVAGATVAMGKKLFEVGAAFVEDNNLIAQSFKELLPDVKAWSAGLSASLGLNQSQMEKNRAQMFLMAKSMGVSKNDAFEMSGAIVELAQDMGSMHNIPFAEMFEKIRSGIAGQPRPLMELGKALDLQTVKQTAATMEMIENSKNMTIAEKVMARYRTLVEQTATEHGDLARTITSPANAMKVFTGRIDALTTGLGVGFLPAVGMVVASLSRIGSEMKTTDEITLNASRSMVSAVGFIADVIWRVTTGVEGLRIAIAEALLLVTKPGMIIGKGLVKLVDTMDVTGLGKKVTGPLRDFIDETEEDRKWLDKVEADYSKKVSIRPSDVMKENLLGMETAQQLLLTNAQRAQRGLPPIEPWKPKITDEQMTGPIRPRAGLVGPKPRVEGTPTDRPAGIATFPKPGRITMQQHDAMQRAQQGLPPIKVWKPTITDEQMTGPIRPRITPGSDLWNPEIPSRSGFAAPKPGAEGAPTDKQGRIVALLEEMNLTLNQGIALRAT